MPTPVHIGAIFEFRPIEKKKYINMNHADMSLIRDMER